MRLLSQLTDQELIHLFIAGNTTAFDILVRRYEQALYNAIVHVIKDRALAEDILQDVFIKIIKSLNEQRYNEEGKFLPWALRIARNLCLDHIRLSKRIRNHVVLCDQNNMPEILEEENSETKMVQAQNQHVLNDMLCSLPEDQRMVIIFRHYKDMSFKEIAALTNCSVNTALGRMRYGIIKLRKLLKQRQMLLQ